MAAPLRLFLHPFDRTFLKRGRHMHAHAYSPLCLYSRVTDSLCPPPSPVSFFLFLPAQSHFVHADPLLLRAWLVLPLILLWLFLGSSPCTDDFLRTLGLALLSLAGLLHTTLLSEEEKESQWLCNHTEMERGKEATLLGCVLLRMQPHTSSIPAEKLSLVCRNLCTHRTQ